MLGEQRRVISAWVEGVRVVDLYVPNGSALDSDKYGYKLAWLGCLRRYLDVQRSQGEPLCVLGDFNIAPLESDVWSHKQLLDVVSHTAIEIDALTALQNSHDWVDLGRHFIPAPQRLYTWWSYRAKDWTVGDRGRRLDHMWASPAVAAAALAHHVHEPCRSWEKPSDHVPLVTEFRI